MKRIVEKSFAKINIALNVLSKREDGFHELDMIMVPLKLHDSLAISRLQYKRDNFVIMDDFSFYIGDNNIAHKALDTMNANYDLKGQKFKIIIHKNIPMQAGMGGGSSNAAATLRGINKFCRLGVPTDRLFELSKPLGSDVPFFVYNTPARCQGKGEIITPINIKNNYYVLIVKPEKGCSTKTIFAEFDKNPNYKGCDIDKVVKALEEGDDDLLAEAMGNSLQPYSIKLIPEIQTIIDSLKNDGLKIVQMTGSGSTVFALSTDKKLLKKLARKYEDKYLVELTEVLK